MERPGLPNTGAPDVPLRGAVEVLRAAPRGTGAGRGRVMDARLRWRRPEVLLLRPSNETRTPTHDRRARSKHPHPSRSRDGVRLLHRPGQVRPMDGHERTDRRRPRWGVPRAHARRRGHRRAIRRGRPAPATGVHPGDGKATPPFSPALHGSKSPSPPTSTARRSRCAISACRARSSASTTSKAGPCTSTGSHSVLPASTPAPTPTPETRFTP